MISRRGALAYLAFGPAVAWAQPAPGLHRIGTLSGGFSPKGKEQRNWPAFFEGMRKLGYEEGRNVAYEMRYARKTARALGVKFPSTILARAERVIE